MQIDELIAKRLRALRKARQMTLTQMAALSGVSASMLSLIERQETSPTAVVLARLADALDLTLPELFACEASSEVSSPVSRRADQVVWQDPASGYQRRHLSPNTQDTAIDLVEVLFPAGATVAFEYAQRQVQASQQLWLLQGRLDVRSGHETWLLKAGDCLVLTPSATTIFHNPGKQTARYVLALEHSPRHPRSTA